MARNFTTPGGMKRNQSYEMTEQHYDQVDTTAAPSLSRRDVKETTTAQAETSASLVNFSEQKKNRTSSTHLVIVAVVLLSLLILSLVAAIVYSTVARTPSQDDLSLRVQQLERQLSKLQVIQGTNFTVDQLFALQDAQESLEDRVDQLSLFETAASSQLISVQSLVQTLSRIQTGIVDDLSSLHTVNVFEHCIEETRSCSVTTSASGNYYWSSCRTGSISINRTGYYTLGIKCDYTSASYLPSSIITKNSRYVYCNCDVTSPSFNSDSHNSLPTSYSATCMLTVTRCPLSEDIFTNVN